MPKTSRSVSSCTMPTKKAEDNLYVKIKNKNEKLSRQLNMNVYDKDSPTKELLPLYINDELTHIDTLEPGAEKVYRIDVSNVENKVVFQIIQEMGPGVSVATRKNSKNPSTVELHIK
ncbi:hypothetical protein ELQ35_10580 [Peribacillus cavernae]|uniref:Uncharacterized protein n=1 Tax=Peribacillus cavernae TaxID=1674310 RepID=A0A3S0VNG2_9BACI|nr:hypothetical protein [Peribacillus cavernae]MDQ0218884.1 hypothetical protein [Peribacillus cavernae]RUQ29394.1 hypothetical protein ELQ35_10580 [Peribacillus cavernae]